ncbi:hypothetical protein IMY05_C4794000100 [Salix suchowensis]|nr:hypothetical protein IMY05_C4794000100 [Salix suchowensis]
MSARHTALHDEYTTEFNEEDITVWKQMIVDWESDRTKPNPFEETDTYLSMAAVRLELAREEVNEPACAQSNSPNEFLYKGLEIEELQLTIACSSFVTCCESWQALSTTSTQVGFGQGPNTRAHSQITHFKSKITLVAECYRAAYQALLRLDPQGSWITRLRKLEDNDIQWPTRNLDEAGGTHEISWIWWAHTVCPMLQHNPHAPPSLSSPSQTLLPMQEAVVPNSASNSEIGKGQLP